MVGEFTEAQTKKSKKMHRIRNELVRNVFNFYKTYNHLYDNVFPNNDVLDSYYSDEMIAQQLVDYADDDDAYYDEAIFGKRLFRAIRTHGMDAQVMKLMCLSDVVVQNELPIGLDGFACSVCGATSQHFVPLPIPDKARKDPMAGIYSARARASLVEPALFRCDSCKTLFSSQYVLRGALLKKRPFHWPVWKDPLSLDAVMEQADIEMKCRNTRKCAMEIIDERERLVDSLSCEDDVKTETGMTPLETTALLDQSNSA
ncbi:unnamed protein product [Phytophthora lilii]|uniref:Unnamed protein product n=1 Tax=Phytophthora lilii TaxID=2077276 RepID=A0A9W6TU51_9STRA|nr:unnamed protein product [Phytophthora lilii]